MRIRAITALLAVGVALSASCSKHIAYKAWLRGYEREIRAQTPREVDVRVRWQGEPGRTVLITWKVSTDKDYYDLWREVREKAIMDSFMRKYTDDAKAFYSKFDKHRHPLTIMHVINIKKNDSTSFVAFNHTYHPPPRAEEDHDVNKARAGRASESPRPLTGRAARMQASVASCASRTRGADDPGVSPAF